jgi:hypothetical protein
MFRWVLLRRPITATGVISLFGIELTRDEAIHFKDLEFIIDHLNNLCLLPEGDDSSAVVGAWPVAGHHHCMP